MVDDLVAGGILAEDGLFGHDNADGNLCSGEHVLGLEIKVAEGINSDEPG